MTLNREQILQASDLPTETTDVPEWGGEIIVRGLSSFDADAFEASLNVKAPDGQMVQNLENTRARLLVLSLVDDAGNRLFTDSDAGQLGTKSGLVTGRLFNIAARLSGIGNEGDKAVADAVGESAPDPADGSPST